MPFCGLDKPNDNLTEVLLRTTLHKGMTIKIRDQLGNETMDIFILLLNNLFSTLNLFSTGNWVFRPDFIRAAAYLLKEFRNGSFGEMLLDDIEKKNDVT